MVKRVRKANLDGMDATAIFSSQTFRNAMARVPTAVHIVTTDGPHGRGGMTASAVCPVTDAPPTLLICLNRASRTNRLIKANGVLAVNTLRAEQHELSRAFAGQRGLSMDGRFGEAEWTTLSGSSPILTDGFAAFDCRVTEIKDIGSHSVIFAEIITLKMDAGASALVYADRRYQPPAL